MHAEAPSPCCADSFASSPPARLCEAGPRCLPPGLGREVCLSLPAAAVKLPPSSLCPGPPSLSLGLSTEQGFPALGSVGPHGEESLPPGPGQDARWVWGLIVTFLSSPSSYLCFESSKSGSSKRNKVIKLVDITDIQKVGPRPCIPLTPSGWGFCLGTLDLLRSLQAKPLSSI